MFLLFCSFLFLDLVFLLAVVHSDAPKYDGDRVFFGFLGYFAIPAVLFYVTGTEVLPFVTENWPQILMGLGAYVLCAVSWSLFKWWRLLVNARRLYKEYLTTDPMPEGHFDSEDTSQEATVFRQNLNLWARHIPGHATFNTKTNKLEVFASSHKYRILSWMAFWPISIVGTVLNFLFYRLWSEIYHMLQATYQRISDHVLSD